MNTIYVITDFDTPVIAFRTYEAAKKFIKSLSRKKYVTINAIQLNEVPE